MTRDSRAADDAARRQARDAYDVWHASHLPDSADAPWHELVKTALDVPGKRILEIGCGRGGFAVWLAKLPPGQRPSEIVAADFSPAAVAMAREYAESQSVSGIDFRTGDLMALEFPEANFDAAISCETIEHVPDSRRALAELARVLKPGGRLYLTFPNYLNLLGLHRLYLPLTGRAHTEGGQPINHFLMTPLVLRWLRKAGLRIERRLGEGHYIPFPGRPPIRVLGLDRVPGFGLFAAHPLIVARKP